MLVPFLWLTILLRVLVLSVFWISRFAISHVIPGKMQLDCWMGNLILEHVGQNNSILGGLAQTGRSGFRVDSLGRSQRPTLPVQKMMKNAAELQNTHGPHVYTSKPQEKNPGITAPRALHISEAAALIMASSFDHLLSFKYCKARAQSGGSTWTWQLLPVLEQVLATYANQITILLDSGTTLHTSLTSFS